MADLEQTLLNPSTVFKQPEDIVANKKLSREQKIKALQTWEYDLREISVADDESMSGGEPMSGLLQRIHESLTELNHGEPPQASSPNKQGGL